MKKLPIILLSLLPIIVSFTLTNPAPTKVHVIVVGDTNASDIGYSVKNDIIAMNQLYTQMSVGVKADFNFQFYKLKGDQLNKRSLKALLKKVVVQKDKDLIFFYFSGHGTFQKGEQLPVLELSTKKGKTEPYKLSDVIKAIESKSPKFAFVFSDSCRKEVGKNDGLRAVDIGRISPTGAKQLLIQMQKTNTNNDLAILLSCGPQDVAYVSDQGSYCTMQFVQSFLQGVNGQNQQKEIGTILETAKKATKTQVKRLRNRTQVPYYTFQ